MEGTNRNSGNLSESDENIGPIVGLSTDANESDSNASIALNNSASTISWGNLQPADFFFGRTLGEGAFARVVHAKRKNYESLELAIKIMDKSFIKKENKIAHVMTEKRILTMLSRDPHPFIIGFRTSFQDLNYLYMCFDLAHGGELLNIINQKRDEYLDKGIEDRACSIEVTQFYIAEIIEAIEYLHKFDPPIIHRDLKPENILLTSTGHIKVSDFGTSLICNGESDAIDFVGTADYVSPEVLRGDDATKACDLWAVGCMTYQMITGRSPFREANEYLIFEAIKSHIEGTKPLEFPEIFNNNDESYNSCRRIISELLVGEERNRLGAGDDNSSISYEALKQHPFFHNIAWGDLQKLIAPYQPDAASFPSSEHLFDGASDEWLFEGDPTQIIEHPQRITTDARQTVAGGGAGTVASSIAPLSPQSRDVLWKSYLMEGEVQVFTGLIYKRKGLFSKKRQLILTDRPRLIYIDPDSMELKGEIPWTYEKPKSLRGAAEMLGDYDNLKSEVENPILGTGRDALLNQNKIFQFFYTRLIE
eukprot:gene5426-7516_t